ncbi:putative fasciclin-like arabinogalactan protein 20 [Vigna radiata var. radiata]|uniref:Fasciclin-like arabinogalactan protein 20 n=1 Tax=Vigna radiata var. radiata TaxID=3916 RepID=A0A1S3VN74_VIGRR|nr:putative fasciclin-like arabinogalactan protein 20 [Vigna radiata var. radiata]
MASPTTSFLTLSLLLLILLPISSATSATLLDAVEILSSLGFQCMALHLELASQTLQPHHSLTIFAPTDAAFERLPHHLSLSLLRYHLLPHAFSLHSLTSLPFGASIPTLLPNHSLTITTTSPTITISINNVTLLPSRVFHHPNLTIFPTTNFFDPRFHLTPPHPRPKPNPPTICLPSPHNPLSRAARLLRSHRFSLVASLLDLQLPSAYNRCKLTLFAPLDKALIHARHNLTHLSALLRHHLVPCKIVWRELVELRDGTLIGTYEKGFSLNVTMSKTHTLLLNGVQVIFPDMFRGDCLVVHGVQHVFSGHNVKRHHHAKHDTYRVTDAQDYDEHEVSSHSPEFDDDNRHGEGNSAGHYHFSVFH